MKKQDHESSRLNRRDAMKLLGIGAAGAGVSMTFGGGEAQMPEATEQRASSLSFPDGAVIRTILGDIDPDVLVPGATLIHEHLSFDYQSPPVEPRYPDTPPAPKPSNDEAVELMVEELKMAHFDGVNCIVDSSVGPRTAQQLANLRAMALRSNMHIVVGGSYFRQPSYPADIIAASQEEITQRMVEQSKQERWGSLGEVGSSFPEMTKAERKVITATAQVHRQTGLPIFTHVPHESCTSCTMDQLDLYDAEGVDMAHLAIGHQSTIKPADDPTWQTHKEVASRGAFVSLDTLGRQMSSSFIPEREKVNMVLNLIEAGYEDHILLSSDFANAAQLKANWGNGFSSVVIQFVPKLRYFGVPDETIQKILVDNPRRWLACLPKM